MRPEPITFSFGENWKNLVAGLEGRELASAVADIRLWLGDRDWTATDILDIGCGSGLHSLAFHQLGARRIHSFDYDPHSVEATRTLHQQAGAPAAWAVEHGSVLDLAYLSRLGTFDLVYSWGVLHHTGEMWKAIGNAATCVRPGGQFFIALYKKGPTYERDLEMKRKYNRSSRWGKWLMERRKILGLMKRRLKAGKNPFAWNEKKSRGMNAMNDIVDWLGGLPYEVATEDEVVVFLRPHGLVLERIKANPESTCSLYVFSRY